MWYNIVSQAAQFYGLCTPLQIRQLREFYTMNNSNTFRFATFVAALGLGVGFLVSGCGDSGSTIPNPLGTTDYKVIFQYNSLAQELGRTDVQADIVKVEYAFYGTIDNKDFITNATKAYEFKHENANQEQDIEVGQLVAGVSGVSAAYYDKDDKLIAVGYNDIDWQGGKTVTIANPDLYRIGQDNDGLSLTSFDPATGDDKSVFKPGEGVGLSFELLPNGDTENTYDLTPFATFGNLNDIEDDKVAVLTADQNSFHGNFIAAANGTVVPQATIDSAISYTAVDPIYVTEQTINGIELSPANDDITVTDKNFGIAYIVKKDANGQDIPNATLGKKILEAEGLYGDLTMGVDEVPMKAIAIYTTDKKGPQPQNINIIDKVELTTAFSEGTGEPLLKADKGTLIATGTAVEHTCDSYKVTAKYGDITDSNQVIVSYTEPELCFAWYNNDHKLVYAESYRHCAGATELYVVGCFRLTNGGFGTYQSKPFFIDESLVGQNEYPEVIVENEPACPFDVIKRADDGSNKYTVNMGGQTRTGHEIKVGAFKVEMPKFVPFTIIGLD